MDLEYGLYYHNKTQYIHSPIFERRPIYTHQNGNINPTSESRFRVLDLWATRLVRAGVLGFERCDGELRGLGLEGAEGLSVILPRQ